MQTFKEFLGFEEEKPMSLEEFVEKYNWKNSYLSTTDYLERYNTMLKYYRLRNLIDPNPFIIY